MTVHAGKRSCDVTSDYSHVDKQSCDVTSVDYPPDIYKQLSPNKSHGTFELNSKLLSFI